MNVLGYLAVITNASMITFVGSKDAADRGKNIGECQDIPRDPLNGPCAKDLRPYGCWPAPGGVYDKDNSYEAYEFDCLDQAYGLNSRGMSWELWLRVRIPVPRQTLKAQLIHPSMSAVHDCRAPHPAFPHGDHGRLAHGAYTFRPHQSCDLRANTHAVLPSPTEAEVD